MPAPPTAVTIRAFQILRSGPIQRDVLICHLWPLVDPGIAFRERQNDVNRQATRRRAHGRPEVKHLVRELTASEVVELGARRRVKAMIKSWLRDELVEQVLIDDRVHVKLVREPRLMPREESAK